MVGVPLPLRKYYNWIMGKFIFILILLFYGFAMKCFSQQVTLHGRVFDAEDVRIPVPACIVVNMRTGQGLIADENGFFSINIYTTDTIGFRNIGYEFKVVRLKDSLITQGFLLKVFLKKQSYLVKEITIFPHRSLDIISKDAEKLGYDESKFLLKGLDAISSPITAIYQAFSRHERSKREVAFMLNEDERRKLLRELLTYYASAGYIEIREAEYDPFINYCAINDAQMKTLTQYEMAVYIKRKLELFRQGRK